MWRPAEARDDETIVRLCLALNAEDPGPEPVPAEHMRRTLRELRERPLRGRALALELAGRVCGYALAVSYWSNEAGGESYFIDEIYVEPDQRGRGHATRLFEDLAARKGLLLSDYVALLLEVSAANTRARRLYERLGFQPGNLTLRRRL
jgi:ribosomal protein S18 acetylase RimI-like enzyme